MKPINKASIVLLVFAMLMANLSFSQAFEGKGSTTMQIGIGGSNYFVFDRPSNPGFNPGWANGHSGVALPSFSMSFGVHKYISLGFWLSANHDFRYNAYSLGIPLFFRADFHFYQLIEDKNNSDIKGNELDIYAGMAIGGGPAFIGNSNFSDVYGIFGVGPHVGIRWYPGAGNIGMYAEIAPFIGKSFAEFGLTLKL